MLTVSVESLAVVLVRSRACAPLGGAKADAPPRSTSRGAAIIRGDMPLVLLGCVGARASLHFVWREGRTERFRITALNERGGKLCTSYGSGTVHDMQQHMVPSTHSHTAIKP
eukprot:scaffold19711_cov42-Phaeocystis_antarctica.AAC.1